MFLRTEIRSITDHFISDLLDLVSFTLTAENGLHDIHDQKEEEAISCNHTKS
jgi:hypothetical protein